MVNEEHLKILKQGSEVWNQWIREHFAIQPNLSGASLRYADLIGADLRGALLGAADLAGAEMMDADLRGAKLYGACLRGADLSGANLSHTDLSCADMSNARLKSVNLTMAQLQKTSFFRTLIGQIIFAGNDLRHIKHLETVTHLGPSHLSINTIYQSEGNIPEVFLQGCGLGDWEIEATKLYRTDLSSNQLSELVTKIHELRSDPLIRFNSCFISYSSQDEKFATRIYSDLQGSGVRCWFAPEHMKLGDRIRKRIDDSIRLHDKLLLILSETSVNSQWIEQEVATALEKEREQGCDVLFPVQVDDAVKDVRSDWPALIRNTRHIGDFRQWNDANEYQKSFAHLLGDLRVGA